MTTKTDTTDNSTSAFTLPSVKDATQGIRDLNERWLESSKSAGLVTLDAHEKTLTSIADFEKKVASDSQVEWVSDIATTHAKLLSDITTSYTTAARDLLK